jgi:thiamine pyrophosphate-dependent acetolactate synthase large subunit-like protein
MVALSLADGYARLTGKPQCVLVHVDVGTQGLGAAIHNASCGRAPVLIFAGLSPFTIEGELRGSRTEYIHWIQDVPDQQAIVKQYCRYSGEIKTGRNVKQIVGRALQFATSDPAGPVYLCGAREVMEEDLTPYNLEQIYWSKVGPAALSQKAVETIANDLVNAERPLVVTGYSGRNHDAVGALVKLADTVKGLRVLDTGGSDMCFPADHRAWLGLRYGIDEAIKSADVILVIDCGMFSSILAFIFHENIWLMKIDVPWIPTQCRPSKTAKVYHVDIDPLKQQMPVHYIDALSRHRADAFTSITQLTSYITSSSSLTNTLSSSAHSSRWEELAKTHEQRISKIKEICVPHETGGFGTSYLCSTLKGMVPKDTIFAIEAVTNTAFVADALQCTLPGSWLNCGGGGLGWSGGGALGIKLASEFENGNKKGAKEQKGKFVVQIVGDGTFLFSVPGSVYWISRRYNIPVLTIVLNNKGW